MELVGWLELEAVTMLWRFYINLNFIPFHFALKWDNFMESIFGLFVEKGNVNNNNNNIIDDG